MFTNFSKFKVLCSGYAARSFLTLSAKEQPKGLNSATFEMKIYWPKMAFECCTWIQMDDLRPPLLIYASKTII